MEGFFVKHKIYDIGKIIDNFSQQKRLEVKFLNVNETMNFSYSVLKDFDRYVIKKIQLFNQEVKNIKF